MAAADPVASRLAAAQASGAERLLDVSRESLPEAARRASDGRGFDFVFVCPGKSAVIAEAMQTIAPGGTLLLFTMPSPEDRLALDGNDLYFREVQVIPSYSCGPVEMNLARTLLVQNRIRVSDLVSHRFPIERAPEAFARARDPNGAMKVVLRFD